jgi:hypothetical protein
MTDADGRDTKVCFYCLETQNIVCVCVGCRTKLEMARADLTRLKKDMDLRREAYWRTQNDRKAELKRQVREGMTGKKTAKKESKKDSEKKG